jgi:uncharacterized protein YecT (DUF1311 family)
MKHISFLFLCILTLECFPQTSPKCDYQSIDKQLNVVYNKIIVGYKADTLFIKRLKEAQRAWIIFRDAQIAARYPILKNEDSNVKYGSEYSDCTCNDLTELTKQRINQLEMWLNGTEEGNVCSGSYKIK